MWWQEIPKSCISVTFLIYGTRNAGSDERGMENRWKFVDVSSFQERGGVLQMFDMGKYPAIFFRREPITQ